MIGFLLFRKASFRQHHFLGIRTCSQKRLTRSFSSEARKPFYVGIDGIPGTGRGFRQWKTVSPDASLLYPTGGGAIRIALAVLYNLPYEKQNLLESIVINKDNARILHNQMKKVESLQESIDEQMKVLGDLHKSTAISILYPDPALQLVARPGAGVFLWRSLLPNRRPTERSSARIRR